MSFPVMVKDNNTVFCYCVPKIVYEFSVPPIVKMPFLITNIIKQTGYIGPKCKLLHITSKKYHASVLIKICVPENVEPRIYSPST